MTDHSRLLNPSGPIEMSRRYLFDAILQHYFSNVCLASSFNACFSARLWLTLQSCLTCCIWEAIQCNSMISKFNIIQLFMKDKEQGLCSKRFVMGLIGCFGGMFIHLIIGSLYQWGIINIYITSYYRTIDSNVTLESNAIAFPVMMLCIGLTMRLGLFLAQCTHPLILMAFVVIAQALFIFVSSYATTIGTFIVLYGVMFGLCSGLNFMVPLVECNKYFPGRKMYVNGVVLTGTGLGSVVFGLFSYNFLNPMKVPPQKGYYLGTEMLKNISLKVPECLRWLSLLYLLIGLMGVFMIAYVCLENRKAERARSDLKQKEQSQQPSQQKNDKGTTNSGQLSLNQINLRLEEIGAVNISSNNQIVQKNGDNEENLEEESKKEEVAPIEDHATPITYPTTLKQGFCTKVCWLSTAIVFFGSCGLFLLNGNYKTYVKNTISNDELLTVVGVVGSLGNGCSRFFWNLLFNHTGFRFVLFLNLVIQLIVYSILRFTVYTLGVYLFLLFLNGCCLGGFLVLTPTFLQIVFGEVVGPNIYGFFWEIFGLANLVQYAYVSGLSNKITFNNVIYICLGMSVFSLILVIFGNFQAPWKNPTDQLGYCRDCQKKEK